jgi:hypothetical protein
MQRLLQHVMSEIQRESLVLSDDGSDANMNLRCLSIPTSASVDMSDLVSFLREVAEIRRVAVQNCKPLPAVFYAWHDEAAGQLRFSTAACTTANLPFRAPLELVDDPAAVVREFLQSRLRDGIPWTELTDAEANLDSNHEVARDALKVWALDLRA